MTSMSRIPFALARTTACVERSFQAFSAGTTPGFKAHARASSVLCAVERHHAALEVHVLPREPHRLADPEPLTSEAAVEQPVRERRPVRWPLRVVRKMAHCLFGLVEHEGAVAPDLPEGDCARIDRA
jgi:hypothetical protein